MVTVEPKHVAMWRKAHALTKPSAVEEKPVYSAVHRQRAGKKIESERPAEVEPVTE